MAARRSGQELYGVLTPDGEATMRRRPAPDRQDLAACSWLWRLLLSATGTGLVQGSASGLPT